MKTRFRSRSGEEIKVSNGEEVVILPAKTAQNPQAIAAISDVIEQSNDGRKPAMGMSPGGKYAGGAAPHIVDARGQVYVNGRPAGYLPAPEILNTQNQTSTRILLVGRGQLVPQGRRSDHAQGWVLLLDHIPGLGQLGYTIRFTASSRAGCNSGTKAWLTTLARPQGSMLEMLVGCPVWQKQRQMLLCLW